MVLAAVAILAGIVVVATGRGGELALPVADSARYGRELVSASDLAAFRPPTAFLGYSAQATDEAMRRIARVVAERDSELAMLRHEVAVLRARQLDDGTTATPAGARDGAAGDGAAGDGIAGDRAAGDRAAGDRAALDPFVDLEPDPAWGDGGWTGAETTDE